MTNVIIDEPSTTSSKKQPASLRVLRVITATAWYVGLISVIAAVVVTVVAIVSPGTLSHNQELPMTVSFLHGEQEAKGPAGSVSARVQFNEAGLSTEIRNRVSDRTPGLNRIKGVGQLHVDSPSTALTLLSMATWMSLAGLFLFGVRLIRQVLKSVAEGNPFDEANPQRLRRVGYLAIIAGPVCGIIDTARGLAFRESLALNGAEIQLNLDIHGNWILAGLVVLLVAYLFDHAVQMKREQELTI